jgi:4-amino-4-deoxy-L-arabinose transferase-like glycosyltransferase
MAGFSESGELSAAQRKLLDYTTAHQGSAAYAFATTSWNGASPYILATGAHVLPIGGFSGSVPFPTEAQFRHLVDTGKLRYVLLGGGRGMGAMPGGSGSTATSQITHWVQAACIRVPASVYGGTTSDAVTATVARFPALADERATAQTLYRCAPGR